MAGKAKTTSAKNNPNKNIIIGVCIAAITVVVIAVAVFFATKKPQITDAYFVSDNTKYVMTSSAEEIGISENAANAPLKVHLVYGRDGDKITSMTAYAVFADESAAKAALDDFKKEVEEMSKSVYVNGKYVVAEMKDEIFKGSTIDDVQESEEYEVVEDYDE
ncbi:MAG: hypothetical protein U0L97_03815 [Candidatus Saccharimonadaceae bacterium]|nr:hypothetical protein [Candidatus Saccharimonadaceae bacterium]